jgi:F0F1-type ATP synthase assembly protein I
VQVAAMASGNKDLMKYMGLAMQIMASLLICTYLGHLADKKLNSNPIFTIVLPLLILIGIFYKIYKESTHQK